MRKWLYTVRSGRASIPLVIGLGLVVLTAGMSTPVFLASMGVTAQMATAAMFMGGALLGSILISTNMPIRTNLSTSAVSNWAR